MSSRRSQPVAETHPGCRIHRRKRGRSDRPATARNASGLTSSPEPSAARCGRSVSGFCAPAHCRCQGCAAMRIRWHVRTVETAGQSTWSSLAFSPSGQPAIAYYSSLNSALKFATLNPDGSWAISTVDTVASDCKPSLAFRSGRPAISYRVGANEFWGALKFALYTGGSSPGRSAPSHRTAMPARSPSNSSQRAGISYYDPISRTLKFARQGSPAPSNWVTETVDPQQNAGDFNALAFTPLSGEPSAPPGDRPVIAYHDQAHNHIKLARFVGTAWDIENSATGYQSESGTGPRLVLARFLDCRIPAVH